MAQAANVVSRQEFERLTIRVEVLTNDVHRLTLTVADIAEDLASFRAETNARFESMEARLSKKIDENNARVDGLEERLSKKIEDGQTAILSAIVALGRR